MIIINILIIKKYYQIIFSFISNDCRSKINILFWKLLNNNEVFLEIRNQYQLLGRRLIMCFKIEGFNIFWIMNRFQWNRIFFHRIFHEDRIFKSYLSLKIVSFTEDHIFHHIFQIEDHIWYIFDFDLIWFDLLLWHEIYMKLHIFRYSYFKMISKYM